LAAPAAWPKPAEGRTTRPRAGHPNHGHSAAPPRLDRELRAGWAVRPIDVNFDIRQKAGLIQKQPAQGRAMSPYGNHA
jgi:hypothetical protein